MADQKISELVEKTIPVGDDLLAIVDSEAVPIETKKIRKSNLVVGFASRMTVYLAGAYTPSAATTWLKVPLDTTLFDNNSEWDNVNHRWVCKVAGTYAIEAHLAHGFSGANENDCWILLKKNGTDEMAQGVSHSNTVGGTYACAWPKCFALLVLAVNDYLEVWAYDDATGDTYATGVKHCAMSVWRIA